LLDNILETSIDQHFHTMIQNRHIHRRKDFDDNLSTEIIEENGDSLFEPPEVTFPTFSCIMPDTQAGLN
jgi:hypothetical protein